MKVHNHPHWCRLQEWLRLLAYLSVCTYIIDGSDSQGSESIHSSEVSVDSSGFVEVNISEWQENLHDAGKPSQASSEEHDVEYSPRYNEVGLNGRVRPGFWGSVIATPWSHKVHGEGETQTRLLLDSAEGRITEEVNGLKTAMAPDEFWHFLVGYRDHDAVERATTTANASPVLLKDGSGQRWFFLYTDCRTADALREDPSYHAVEPLPASLKIDPFGLGKKVTAVRDRREVPRHLRGPVALKAVLAQRALTLREATILASDWQTSLQIQCPEISCRVEDESAAVCEPVSDESLEYVAEWMSKQAVTLFVEIRPRFKTCNKWAREVVQSLSGAATPIHEMGLRGEGQVIGVADTGVDLNHCFFYDAERPQPIDKIDPEARKVIQYVAFGDQVDGEVGGHGTHVAGSIAGNPLLGDDFAGIASSAKLAFFDISTGNLEVLLTPINLGSSLFPYAYQAGARIHSNSWGSPAEGYGSDAHDVDDYLYKHDDMLIIFAAGNDGDTKNGTQTISTPGIAKNVLTVGACMNSVESFKGDGSTSSYGAEYAPSSIADFSSQGPTADGRIKPDLVAPGMYVVSAKSQPGASPSRNCDKESLQGTSVATPQVAGMAALIRQYFQLGFYPTGVATPVNSFSPTGALMKAMLIHSAEPEKLLLLPSGKTKKLGSGPDSFQGFGRAVLENVLVFKDPPENYMQPSALYVRSGRQDGSIATHGMAHLYKFNVTSNTKRLRATLVWMDPAGSPNSVQPLVNDLNLRLILPNGSSLYPNGLSSPDKLNNVEVVNVPGPAVGVWIAAVEGTSVCCKGQPYALVLTGPFSPPSGFFSNSTPSVPNRNGASFLRPQGMATRASMAGLLLFLYSLVTSI